MYKSGEGTDWVEDGTLPSLGGSGGMLSGKFWKMDAPYPSGLASCAWSMNPLNFHVAYNEI